MPTISVIIPAYNAEKTIEKTIKSVCDQTFSDWELIVINDGSTDNTKDIVSQIKDDRILLFSFENAGLPASRNRGVEKSSGEFVAFVDADDLWTSDKLELQLKALQDNPKAAVAYSWTDYIDESDRVIYSGRHISLSGNIYEKLLVRHFLENGSNFLIRKAAYLEVGGSDESLRAGEDWDLCIRLSRLYEFVAVSKTHVLYRVSPLSMSSNTRKQELECLRVLEKAYRQAPQSVQQIKKESLADLYKYLLWKTLASSQKHQGLRALYFLWNYTKNSNVRAELTFIYKMFVKSIIAI
ncbi:MAG: glycosyltransferase [Cyanobacteria bacterium J06592_8]